MLVIQGKSNIIKTPQISILIKLNILNTLVYYKNL